MQRRRGRSGKLLLGLKAAFFWPHLKDQHNLKNDCSLCATNPKIARAWGCKADSPERGGFVYELGETVTRRCPISLFKPPDVQDALRLYRSYKAGHLPCPGAMGAQSALFEEVMFHCESFEVQAANWDMEQTKRKAEKLRKARRKRGKGNR